MSVLDGVTGFVERLLDDWEGDEYQIAGEFCTNQAEHDAVEQGIAGRRAEWDALADALTKATQ